MLDVLRLESIIGNESQILGDRSFQLLLLSNMIPPLGTALMSPVLGSLIIPLGATPANIGFMMSAFTAPAILGIPIFGMVADRYGRRPVILFGLILFGLAGSSIALTTSLQVALFLRMLQGVGFAALTPIIITSIGDLYSGTQEATAQGFRFAGSGLSQTIFPLGAGVLVSIAWQYPFLLYAISFPIAVVIYIYFEEPVDPDATKGTDEDLRTQLNGLWSLVSQRRVWAMVIARGTPNVVWLGFLTYNSIIVTDLIGGSPTEAGVLAALGSISYALSATQAGRIFDLFDDQFYPLVLMNIMMAIGLSVVFIADSIVMAYIGVMLMGIGFGISLSLYRSILTKLAPVSSRGGLVSLAESGGRLTSTLTPIIMGSAIALATQWLTFDVAVQTIGIGTCLIAAGIGIGSLSIFKYSPPVEATSFSD